MECDCECECEWEWECECECDDEDDGELEWEWALASACWWAPEARLMVAFPRDAVPNAFRVLNWGGPTPGTSSVIVAFPKPSVVDEDDDEDKSLSTIFLLRCLPVSKMVSIAKTPYLIYHTWANQEDCDGYFEHLNL